MEVRPRPALSPDPPCPAFPGRTHPGGSLGSLVFFAPPGRRRGADGQGAEGSAERSPLPSDGSGDPGPVARLQRQRQPLTRTQSCPGGSDRIPAFFRRGGRQRRRRGVFSEPPRPCSAPSAVADSRLRMRLTAALRSARAGASRLSLLMRVLGP